VRVDEHRIEFDGAPVFYRSAPARGIPPLYLHGVPTSSDDWLPFLGRTGGFAPDLIGFGRSSKAGHLDYSVEGLARFLERFVDEVGVDRVKLVGHGWGAGVALRFAHRQPERVERVVICNALPPLEGFGWHRLARLWRRPVVGELLMGFTNQWLLARTLRKGAVRRDAWPDARLAQVWEQFDQGTQRAILRLHRSARGVAAPNAVGRPVLVIWGERDPWLPIELGEAYAAWLPESTLERVPDAGHWPWLDKPEVVDGIAAFLEGGHEAPG
jgi:pimeloyl-ACP methyl ester carboxylesterase